MLPELKLCLQGNNPEISLSPDRVRRAGVFDPAYVTRLQDEHERGVANHRKLLWTLLMFELWHESFIETPRRIETSVGIGQ